MNNHAHALGILVVHGGITSDFLGINEKSINQLETIVRHEELSGELNSIGV